MRRESVPDGPIRAFFDGLHRQHLLAGEPSTRELARKAAYSHTTVHKAMRGPRLPRWGLVELLVEALGGDRDQFHELWVAARDEEHRLDAGSSLDLPPAGATSTATLTRPTPPRDGDADRSGDVPPPTPGPLAAVTLPEGTRAPLGRLGRELAQRAWRENWERGFRDAIQFARECEPPWSVLEELARSDFDVPKWIAGWRNGWADVALGRAREGASVAPWLPRAARYLGDLADPIGHDEFSFTPTALYVKGFGDGLRAVWSAAGGEAATVPGGDESALLKAPLRASEPRTVTNSDLTALGLGGPTLHAMPALSHRTEGLLIRVLGGWSHGQIGTLLREVDLAQFDPGEGTPKSWINKDKRLKQVFDAARSNSSPSVEQAILRLVVEVANRHAGDPDAAPEWLGELKERLLADGYELHQEIVEVTDGWPSRRQVQYRLLPAGAAPAPLGPAVSALEAELEQRSYAVALSHYGQAVRNFTNHDLEAANGQLRSFLESLFVQLARDHAGYVGDEPVAALQQLRDKGKLLDGEFDLLRGWWKLSQGRGAHQGLITAEEALFRLQTTTSAARFLLHHLH